MAGRGDPVGGAFAFHPAPEPLEDGDLLGLGVGRAQEAVGVLGAEGDGLRGLGASRLEEGLGHPGPRQGLEEA